MTKQPCQWTYRRPKVAASSPRAFAVSLLQPSLSGLHRDWSPPLSHWYYITLNTYHGLGLRHVSDDGLQPSAAHFPLGAFARRPSGPLLCTEPSRSPLSGMTSYQLFSLNSFQKEDLSTGGKYAVLYQGMADKHSWIGRDLEQRGRVAQWAWRKLRMTREGPKPPSGRDGPRIGPYYSELTASARAVAKHRRRYKQLAFVDVNAFNFPAVPSPANLAPLFHMDNAGPRPVFLLAYTDLVDASPLLLSLIRCAPHFGSSV